MSRWPVPVAIVGQACVLPGAPDVRALASLLLDGRDAVTEAPEGRWGLPHAHVLGPPAPGQARDRTWTAKGGYVGEGPSLPELAGLDPLVHWLVHCGRQALDGVRRRRAGAIVGNLSFPTDAMAGLGQDVALGRALSRDPRNLFMSGLPAHLLARALDLDAGAYALDAACASSLVAIKLACDALLRGDAELALAGGVQRADNLFLHIGFCQLEAMSASGRSRPFHRGADGLLPAEGCALVALKRLDLAVADGDPILGVIHGAGISNDGRSRALLAPDPGGQARAMRAALQASGWDPATVQLFECHATGTQAGDATEIASMSSVYAGGAIGSLKSNLGHAITAAGAAGVQKVLAGMAAETMPPTLHVDEPIDTGRFSLVAEARTWPGPERRAAVSAFGFGGNNAHVLVSSWTPGAPIHVAMPAPRACEIGIVGVALLEPGPTYEVAVEGLRFPPRDLERSLAQQALVLEAARRAWSDWGGEVHRERAAVFVGIGADPSVTAWGLRWRLPVLVPGAHPGAADRSAPELRAEHVVGTMPNIPANRVNVQLDLAAAGFTVSAEELSGLRAFELAVQGLRSGEIDCALVAAADLCRDGRFVVPWSALGGRGPTADVAVAFVLVRDPDPARAYATLAPAADAPVHRHARGHVHAASILLDAWSAIEAGVDATISREALGGATGAIGLRAGARRPAAAPVAGPTVPLRAHWLADRVETGAPMEPAPALAPVLADATRAARAPVPAAAPIAPVPADRGAPPPAPPSTPPSTPRADSAPAGGVPLAVVLAGAQRARLNHAHAAFVDAQAVAQGAFLAQRAATMRALSEAAQLPLGGGAWREPPRSWPVPAPAPLPAPAPEAAVDALVVSDAERFPGPSLDRAALEAGGRGSIADLLGEDFRGLDAYRRVVRMPCPPLLLADRVLGIEGPARVIGKGRTWTETDVRADSWYVHDGHMPAGIMIESGQADLLLASWQGVDFQNRGERVYRLLGCDLAYLGDLPAVGDTLRYTIDIDAHARLGDVRMFFFHYDCTVRNAEGSRPGLRVRNGQAGFFTADELAASGGILWDPVSEPKPLGRQDAHLATPVATTLDRAALESIAAGDLESTLGPEFRRASTHTQTPTIAGGRMLFLDRATISLRGGPWGGGYLRAEQDIDPGTWFFDGHFHEDPCMPGTLMFEGCCQAMQLFLLAGGHTLHRDGWRFRPVADETFKLRCRGQVIPTSKTLVYEIFVQEVIAGPRPTVRAQVLCTVDGLRCFHADPFAIELVPDWPLERMEAPAADASRPAFDYDSLLACAWGRPSRAFGPMYATFDSERKVPRLPGPPYHFMTRVVSTEGTMGTPAAGAACVVEYEVPPEAWYFRENGARVMPLAVLMETALQPCGWLASWAGCALGTQQDFLFRNLDGTATQHVEVTPATGTLVTRARLDRVSRSGGMILVAFTVTMDARAADGSTSRVYEMTTGFGFFPPEAFANQAGVGSTPDERARLGATGSKAIDLAAAPARGLAGGTLRMIDRITDGGGDYWRSEKDIRAGEWFFKAHFFQDPVQPGSLGIEAMVQLLQVAMAERGLLPDGHRFEGLALGVPLTWKYRGQVVPENRLVQAEVRIGKVEGPLAIADAALWVDGKKIYEARNLGMRVIRGALSTPSTLTLPVPADHCPTWTIPAAPMTTLACALLSATGARALASGEARRWLTFPAGPRPVEVRRVGERAELVADGAVIFSAVPGAPADPPALPALTDARAVDEAGADLYASGALFHGPSFHAVERIVARGADGATAMLRDGLPPDILLDGALHAVPHDAMHTWFPGVPGDVAAYPARVVSLSLHAEARGPIRAELRALGVRAGRPAILAHLFDSGGALVAAMEIEEALLPKGPIGRAPPAARRAFLLGQAVAGLSLSRVDGDAATLSPAEAARSDWLPGTLARVYGPGVSGAADARTIRAKELVAAAEAVHPRDVALSADGALAWPMAWPLRVTELAHDGDVTRRVGARARCLDAVIPWWRARQGGGAWPGEAVVAALVEQYVADVEIVDPRDLAEREGPVLFLANHETYIESALFTTIISALRGVPTRALAKAEHRRGWLGVLHDLLTSYPGRRGEPIIAYFDQANPAALPALLDVVSAESSLLVHVEGTRQVTSGAPVTVVSSAILDLAVRRGLAIVPVAFRGGVAGAKADLPVAPQRHVVGRSIGPETLAGAKYAERRRIVLEAIDALAGEPVSPGAGDPVPSPGQEIARVVEARRPGWSEGAESEWGDRWRALATATPPV